MGAKIVLLLNSNILQPSTGGVDSQCGIRNFFVDFCEYIINVRRLKKVLFLRRAHSPDRPPLDSNPLPTDYETRELTNAPTGTTFNSFTVLLFTS